MGLRGSGGGVGEGGWLNECVSKGGIGMQQFMISNMFHLSTA